MFSLHRAHLRSLPEIEFNFHRINNTLNSNCSDSFLSYDNFRVYAVSIFCFFLFLTALDRESIKLSFANKEIKYHEDNKALRDFISFNLYLTILLISVS